MTREQIKSILQAVLEPELTPLDPPEFADWQRLETRLKTRLPIDFKVFIELMSQYSFPGEIYNIPQALGARTNGNDTIVSVIESEKSLGEWPSHLLPFYGLGNGDYFVLDAREGDKSAVYFKNHADGSVAFYAESFCGWIKKLSDFLGEVD